MVWYPDQKESAVGWALTNNLSIVASLKRRTDRKAGGSPGRTREPQVTVPALMLGFSRGRSRAPIAFSQSALEQLQRHVVADPGRGRIVARPFVADERVRGVELVPLELSLRIKQCLRLVERHGRSSSSRRNSRGVTIRTPS